MELLAEGGADEDILALSSEMILSLEQGVAAWERRQRLALPHAEKDALVTVVAGAGGTDAQDWVAMMSRMYERWASKSNLACKVRSAPSLPPTHTHSRRHTTPDIVLRTSQGWHRLPCDSWSCLPVAAV